MNSHLFIFGYGFTSTAIAERMRRQFDLISGTTRSSEKAEFLKSAGINPVLFDGVELDPFGQEQLATASHVLISIGPNAEGDPVLNACRTLLAQNKNLQWLGYLSTVGVYGDHNGDWVDESTPLTPATKRGIARVKAEAAWADIPDLPLHIFRLAGIYGPGRGPFAKVRNGTARRVIKDGQVFSRTHVADIARVLAASIQRPNAGAAYNVCDDDPAPPQDVIGYAAELLGLPLPPAEDFDTAEMTPMARSFYAESKKVRNDRIKTELGVHLKYPDYKTGLRALVEQET